MRNPHVPSADAAERAGIAMTPPPEVTPGPGTIGVHGAAPTPTSDGTLVGRLVALQRTANACSLVPSLYLRVTVADGDGYPFCDRAIAASSLSLECLTK